MIPSLSVESLQLGLFFKVSMPFLQMSNVPNGWVFTPSSCKSKGLLGHRMVEPDLALEIRCPAPQVNGIPMYPEGSDLSKCTPMGKFW